MSYAKLGQSCQVSMDMLIDNRKFFLIKDPVYNMFYTDVVNYPASNIPLNTISEETEYPEDIKTFKKKLDSNNNHCRSCVNNRK